MGFVNSIFSGELLKWIRRHSLISAVNLTSSIGFVYLWNKERKYLLATVPLFCIGGVYLYSRRRTRDKLSSGQVVVVTGCDSGLGYSLALHCRLLGATVVAGVLRSDAPAAEKLRKSQIFVYPLDITDERSVADFKESVRTLLARKNLVLRCLVNNAGVMIFGEFEWQTDEQISQQVEVNLLGTMRITRELMPIIRADSSRLIVISSHCTSQPLPGVAAYSATKAAINAWATSIRVELKKYGIDVVCFVPGSFTSESNILARQSEHFETMRTSMSEEARTFYGDYFSRYARYFSAIARQVEPEMLRNRSVYEAFEGALLDKRPSAVYKCEPWRYFVYHTLFRITPTSVRDRLVERFVQLPPWREEIADEKSPANTSFPVQRETFRASESKIVTENFQTAANERDERQSTDKNPGRG